MTVSGDSSNLSGSPATLAERWDLAPLWVAVCVIALTYVVGVLGTSEPLHFLLDVRIVLRDWW
jgi:hypothetical protein